MDFDYYKKYFTMLEERLANINKYVSFEDANLDVYSIEFASIINDCCGLINGFCSELCKEKNSKKNRFEMKDYKTYILKNFQKEQLVYCNYGKFILQPWEKIFPKQTSKKSLSPLWWEDYNSIKHSGQPNFAKATLRNAISCMAGMFALLVMYDFKQLGSTMCNWKGFFSDAGNHRKSVSWEC